MTEETKTAKIPEGVTVETPKPTELKKLPIPDFSLDPTLPMITNPHYTNNNKTELACVLLRPDGMATQEKNIPADDKHPLYRDIKKQFSDFNQSNIDLIFKEYEDVLYRMNIPSTFKNSQGDIFTGFIKGVNNLGRLKVLLEDNLTKSYSIKDISLMN